MFFGSSKQKQYERSQEGPSSVAYIVHSVLVIMYGSDIVHAVLVIMYGSDEPVDLPGQPNWYKPT